MRKIVPLIFLMGCTAPNTDTVYRPDGERIDLAYIVLAPLCFFFCNTQVTTTGSRIDGSGSNTQSTTSSITSSQ